MNIESVNPSTGKVLRTFTAATPYEVNTAVSAAKSVQKTWAGLSLEARYGYFQKLKAAIEQKLPELTQLMLEETGNLKPDAEAEVYEVLDAIDYYFEQAKVSLQERPLAVNQQAFPDTTANILLMPYGVLGLIMPWNFPFYSPAMYIIAALMSGNAVVMKPSEYATMTGLFIKQLFDEAGFPKDVLRIVCGAEETGRALVQSAVDKVFFVGSVEAGKDIVQNASIKPVHLEQGGNSAAIVLADANLDTAVRAVAWAGAYHAGQDCVGIKRVFVVEAVADEFLKQLVAAVSKLRPGVDYGPNIRQDARDQVKRRLNEAVRGGAKLLCGGEVLDREGFWLAPSVVVYDDPSIELVAKETFGNTIPVMIVKDTDEAIARANDTVYGLSNAIFTADIEKAEALAQQLESGMVFINDPFVALPGWDHWVGWKDSGLGSPESNIMHCLKKRVQTVNASAKSRDFWFPYPEQ